MGGSLLMGEQKAVWQYHIPHWLYERPAARWWVQGDHRRGESWADLVACLVMLGRDGGARLLIKLVRQLASRGCFVALWDMSAYGGGCLNGYSKQTDSHATGRNGANSPGPSCQHSTSKTDRTVKT